MRFHILLFAALASAAPAHAQASESEAAAPYVPSRDPGEFEQALECLTQAVYYEARNQSADGQRAVAQVVLNRVRHPAYPDSVCGVVFQGSERTTGCQFSFTCDGSMYRDTEWGAWQRAQAIARAALRGSVYRPVGLALNYHTTAIRPYWAPSLEEQAVVGAHIFYRRPNSGAGDFVQVPGSEAVGSERAAIASTQRRAAPERSLAVLEARAQRLGQEIAVIEIPVSERPVRFQTVGSRQSAPSRPAPQNRASAPRSGTRVQMESGVRVMRGS